MVDPLLDFLQRKLKSNWKVLTCLGRHRTGEASPPTLPRCLRFVPWQLEAYFAFSNRKSLGSKQELTPYWWRRRHPRRRHDSGAWDPEKADRLCNQLHSWNHRWWSWSNYIQPTWECSKVVEERRPHVQPCKYRAKSSGGIPKGRIELSRKNETKRNSRLTWG